MFCAKSRHRVPLLKSPQLGLQAAASQGDIQSLQGVNTPNLRSLKPRKGKLGKCFSESNRLIDENKVQCRIVMYQTSKKKKKKMKSLFTVQIGNNLSCLMLRLFRKSSVLTP